MVLLLAVNAARATSFVDVPLAQVEAWSQVVAVGHVVQIGHTMRGGLPFTMVEVAVDRAIRGAPGATMTIALNEGPFPDGRLFVVPGTPHPEVGDQLVVHAAPWTQGAWRLVDWQVGVLQRQLGADGVAVALDGQGAPIAELPCHELPDHAADDVGYLAAMRWDDAIEAVAACAGGAR
ncbi:MAG: hypothetical protein ABMB14_28360 [Myxococcota bacterium]